MGTVTFIGSVSAQATSGEVVTIMISKPDFTTTSTTSLTDPQGGFTATLDDLPGAYTAFAKIAADAKYIAAKSNLVTFTIALADRTIALSTL